MNKSEHLVAPSQAQRLPDEIAATLAKEIRGPSLRSGDQLPSEKQLGVRFGVSRTVVREALSQLKSDGLVQLHKGRGAFVAEARQVAVFRISAECFSKRKELGQLLELQNSVAAQAAGLAAQRRSASDLARMRATLHGMAQALLVGRHAAEQWVSMEQRFYELIVEASGNPYFVEFLAFVQARLSTRLNSVVIKNAKAVEISATVMPEHQAIYDAIRLRDGERAQQLASVHFAAAGARLASRANLSDT